MLPLLVLLGTIAGAWYLLIVRPQKDQQTRHGRLVEQLQVGDHVLTVGGIYGRIEALEGSSVVLELAPGLTTRIATDGIARIVHGGEAAPTALVAKTPPRQATDTDMHQHQAPQDQQQTPQFAAPAYAAPPQPYAPNQLQAMPQPVTQQQPVPMHAPQAPAPAAPAPMHYAPQPVQHAPQPVQYAQQPVQYAQQPVQHVQQNEHVFRAQVVDSIPTFEPRPWGDVQPVNHAAPQPAPQAHQQRPYAQQQAPAVQQQSYQAPPQLPPPPQLTMHVPFTASTQAAPAQGAPAMPQQQAMPQQLQPAPTAGQPAPVHAAPQQAFEAAPDPAPTRRHSTAPAGMGSSLRLDDPSLRDTLSRARQERAGLADEYRKLTAPLVDIGEGHAVEPMPVPDAATFVGHDPNGVPLFAAPGAPVAHPVAQYPAPARVAGNAPVPRPAVPQPQGAVDPALTAAAFQRPTPYTPQDGATAPAAGLVPASPPPVAVTAS